MQFISHFAWQHRGWMVHNQLRAGEGEEHLDALRQISPPYSHAQVVRCVQCLMHLSAGLEQALVGKA